MTNNEIIKALECCKSNDLVCDICPMNKFKIPGTGNCIDKILIGAIDLINRQKAEIEKWKKKANTPFAKITFDRDKLQEIVDEYVKNIEIDINLAKSEAIKEFAERLKCGVPQETGVIRCADIDNLVKEMAGK